MMFIWIPTSHSRGKELQPIFGDSFALKLCVTPLSILGHQEDRLSIHACNFPAKAGNHAYTYLQ